MLLTLFKGSEQDPSVKRGLTWVEERGNFPEETSDHMGDDSQIPEPFAFQALFQALGFCGFLLRLERFEKEKGLPYHLLSLLPMGLLVVTEQKDQLPSGQRRLAKIV